MSNSTCAHETAPAGSLFCPRCGKPISEPERQTDVQIQISQQADSVGEGGMTGLKVGEIKGSMTVVHGNVFHISDPSPELMERLGGVKAVSTEVKPGQAGPGGPEAARLEVLEKNLGEILQHVRAAEQRGEHIDQVQVGTMEISRVELLLKQGVLLKTEADQMFLDHIEQNKHVIERAKQQSAGNVFQVDLADVMSAFDGEAHTAKLRKAYDMFREAQSLDPTNAEVLLHMAKIMGDLEIEPREVTRVLHQVQHLLDPPRSETDKFHLAQAMFLSATIGEYQHPVQLRNARDMFADIDRTDWVRHCDDLLGASPQPDYQAAPGTYAPPPAPQPGFQAAPGPYSQPPAPQPRFQPSGNWHAQLSNGGTMNFQLFPNGAMQGAQQVGLLGMSVNFSGQWGFDPYNRLLHLQGIVAGFTPFVLEIAIQGAQGGAYIGFGSDGQQYTLRQI